MSHTAPTGTPPGRVLLFTGDGKGKTTAALGLGLRAFGHGLSVCVVQFIKNKRDTGEVKAAKLLGERFSVFPMGRGFVMSKGGTAADRARAAEALELARRKTKECDVLVLDEINSAVKEELLDVRDVLSLIEGRPRNLHVILTGRDAHPDLVRAADTVTSMTNIKHGHDDGISAAPGIEH